MNKQCLKGRIKPDHSKRDEGMEEEKRRAPRIKEDDEVTITVVSGGDYRKYQIGNYQRLTPKCFVFLIHRLLAKGLIYFK
jgi:hypothetical protein